MVDTTRDIATKSASGQASFVAGTALIPLPIEQRATELPVFHAKYNAMLNIIEFLASFHLVDTANTSQAKDIEDLKTMVEQARRKLGG